MTVTAAAVFFALAAILALVLAAVAPLHPRFGHVTIALIAIGLFCMATGLGQ